MKSAFVLAGLLLVAACASSEPIEVGGAGAVATTQLPAPEIRTAETATPEDEDRVAPLDVLDITVFQAPDLTRTVRVNLDGEISLPLIGAIPAGGKTVDQVEAAIAERLRQTYMRNPNVTVFIKEKRNVAVKQLTVEGAVKQPGVYDIKGPTTLLQAIALARGVDESANLKGVVVFRKVNNQRMAARFDLTAIRRGQAPDPELFADDIVVVDQSDMRGRTLLRAIISSLPILSVFRPY